MSLRTKRSGQRIASASLLMLAAVLAQVAGCIRVSGNGTYDGPPPRPEAMNLYYSPEESYGTSRIEIQKTTDNYTLKHITVDSYAGPIVIDFFQAAEGSDSLILVFPVLGGQNFIERHLASYFADAGFDAAIVNRSNEFKDPANFDKLEEIFRLNLIRDRLALDYFQNEFGKEKFGTFGISRGAINVAVTAGVDERLKYNVLVMGGTDLVDLFRDSNQPRIAQYIKTVSEQKGFEEEQFFEALRRQVRTDPKNTAQYLDGRDTLLILGIFDRTVPFAYGMKLREQIGRPETIFLCADHYVGVLYTQTVSLVPPSKEDPGLFPFPYVEEEALNFFDKHFNDSINWSVVPYRVLQAPLNLAAEGIAGVGSFFEWAFDFSRDMPEAEANQERETFWVKALELKAGEPSPPLEALALDEAPVVQPTAPPAGPT